MSGPAPDEDDFERLGAIDRGEEPSEAEKEAECLRALAMEKARKAPPAESPIMDGCVPTSPLITTPGKHFGNFNKALAYDMVWHPDAPLDIYQAAFLSAFLTYVQRTPGKPDRPIGTWILCMMKLCKKMGRTKGYEVAESLNGTWLEVTPRRHPVTNRQRPSQYRATFERAFNLPPKK